MKTLWAPWRMEYIAGEKQDSCVFCLAMNSAADLTLYRGQLSLVVMNKYPYTNGHILVAPTRHISSFEDMTQEEMCDSFRLVKESVLILKKIMNPDGFNVGVNLGSVAGAGIEAHLHFHVVPRWRGDANFMTVVGEVRVIPEHINVTYQNFLPHFNALEEAGK